MKFKLYDCDCCHISWGVLSPVHMIASGLWSIASFIKTSKVCKGKSQSPIEPQYPALGLSVWAVTLARQQTGYVHFTGEPSL